MLVAFNKRDTVPGVAGTAAADGLKAAETLFDPASVTVAEACACTNGLPCDTTLISNG